MDYNFINQHLKEPIEKLVLKYSNKGKEILQIECRRKFSSKLSSYISNPNFLFPSILAGEQATNQYVADFNSSFFKPEERVVDMTSGLGIDSISIARKGSNVRAFDIDMNKVDCLKHNIQILNVPNLKVYCEDSLSFIESSSEKFNSIYVDQARRSEDGRKLYILSDTLPDIVGNYKMIMAKCERLIIKASPMVDIMECIRLLPDLKCIYVVSYRGECKELLLLCGKVEKKGVYEISIAADGLISEFKVRDSLQKGDEKNYQFLKDSQEIMGGFIYEPNAGLMKIGDWDAIHGIYPEIKGFSKNTHLFYSERYYPDFPGRIYHKVSVPKKSDLKSMKGYPLNVISRNHPLTASQIEQKYYLKGGKERYLIGCRIGIKEKPELLLTSRIK